ncbi:WcbI family polysaccharide biosynthesis putative acetyltransferase [Marinobacterium mangrovicola]|uniref:WcbI family polysaccharide biosynthesis putative acetyltransferase n=1 Tax=Marinobacterium mangrovicola TaxID=1476959 RepID=UPI00104C23C5|nr:WcbI family polysaccharide biosynthesis putative acetyltransferase [Marinobacterium mangrovicola]
MHFTVYGNCQSKALAESLLCFDDFCKLYSHLKLKAVQNIGADELESVFDVFRKCDLFIEQVISDNYKTPDLASKKLALFKKSSAQTLKFPSIYFGGTFPSFFFGTVEVCIGI